MRLARIVPISCLIATTAYACATTSNEDPANLGEAGPDTGGSIAPPPPDGGVPYDAGIAPFESGIQFETGPVEAAPPGEAGACGATGTPCDPDAPFACPI